MRVLITPTQSQIMGSSIFAAHFCSPLLNPTTLAPLRTAKLQVGVAGDFMLYVKLREAVALRHGTGAADVGLASV